MEVLVQRHDVLPARISRRPFVGAPYRPATVGISREDADEAMRDLVRRISKRDLPTASGWKLHSERVAQVGVEPTQRPHQQVVEGHPDRAAPVAVAAEQPALRLTGFVVDAAVVTLDVDADWIVSVLFGHRPQPV